VLAVHKANQEQIRRTNLIEDDTVFGDLMSDAGAVLSLDGSVVELCKLMLHWSISLLLLYSSFEFMFLLL
jgi:hypothetical protein